MHLTRSQCFGASFAKVRADGAEIDLVRNPPSAA